MKIFFFSWSMVQHLPKCDFKWVKDLEKSRFWDVEDDSSTGYILEVDLHVPRHQHNRLSDLPPCPEHRAAPGSKQKKLLTTLYDKKNYVIHYRALKQAVKLGLVITKIHRAVEFTQEPFLKKYVDFNTEKRTQAKNEFEKMFFKLMINAVFGKYFIVSFQIFQSNFQLKLYIICLQARRLRTCEKGWISS